MKEIACQLRPEPCRHLMPFSDEDSEVLKDYKDHQILKVRLSGFKKPRSLIQLKLFWACCRTVSENTEDQHWNTAEKVAFQIKVALQFVDMSRTIVDSKGNVHLWYRSIAFKNLGHMEACRFFDRAFPIMAKKIGISVDKLLKNANVQPAT